MRKIKYTVLTMQTIKNLNEEMRELRNKEVKRIAELQYLRGKMEKSKSKEVKRT